jgi:peptide/nickel transport system permease protein
MAVATAEVAVRPRRRSGRRLSPTLILGAAILAFSFALAVAPGLVAPYDPLAFDYVNLLKPPSGAHLFGTDNFGRDVLSRTIWAYRIDMQIALFATLPALLVGSAIGALVGYYGGWPDTLFERLVDAVITFPFLVLVIVIVGVLGPGLTNMYIAVGVVGWVFYARLLRAEIRVQKSREYAAAARVMGYTDGRIILRHLLPNAITPIIVYWMTDMALGILLGSSLGYLGLGAQPPAAEWGVLIADGKNFMSTAWWISVFPGIAIVITGLGFSLLGDGLADLLRPRR